MNKLVKISVNTHSNQCRLTVPKSMWNSIPKSGWYEITEDHGVLTYTPTTRTKKMKPQLPIIEELEDEPEVVEVAAEEMDYSKISFKPDTSIPVSPAAPSTVTAITTLPGVVASTVKEPVIIDPLKEKNVWENTEEDEPGANPMADWDSIKY